MPWVGDLKFHVDVNGDWAIRGACWVTNKGLVS